MEFPGISRRFPVAFAIHNRGYFGTGTNGINLNDFWQYNPTINTSGLSENTDVQWSIYPNPSVDYVNIELPDEFPSGQVGEVRNLTGQILQLVEMYPGINRIDVSSMTPGTYFFSFQGKEKPLSKMFKIW